jgi:CheY-like chemotaxis protein
VCFIWNEHARPGRLLHRRQRPFDVPATGPVRFPAGCNANTARQVRPLAAVTLRCLIIDDSPEFLDAARRLLQQEGIAVAGVASSVEDAVRLASELRPDVTLVDIDLGVEDGIALARRLAESDGQPAGKLILISTHAEDEFADLIQASPAMGFISKSALSADAIHLLTGTGHEPAG